MKTDQLIDSLVADQGRKPPGIGGMLLVTLPPAILVSLVLFTYELDMRADLAAALGSWRYLLKLLLPMLVAGTALVLVRQLAQPQVRAADAIRWLPLLLVPLAVGFLAEAVLVPRASWGAAAMGEGALFCLFFVPMLSLAPLAAILWSLARGAPQSPAATGIIAGLGAGGIGALLYAVHCDNDSPFYLAIWYLGGIAIVALIGGIAGRHFLRW
ncbi:MAG: NrsF family protein [Oceanibaculum sp.]|jgi:hypothetical protein